MLREGFDRWLAAAEAQLDAARRVDPVGLSIATDARRATQEELYQSDVIGLKGEDRVYAADIAQRIRAIDLRIQACGAHVLAAIASVAPDARPATYGRRGQLRGV